MNKTKIIKEMVGEQLKEYGFTFLKTDGPCRIFVREKHGYQRYFDPETDIVKQYICIQDSGFSKSVTVRFYTDVYGNQMPSDLDVLKKYGTGVWLGYLDEESYQRRLHLLTEHIVAEGFDLLEELSREEETIPTKAMAEQLFDQHGQLAQAFTEEFHRKAVPEKPEEIDEWFVFIKKLLMDSLELPYEEVKGLLTKIAAFIGEKACEICPYQWVFQEHLDTPQILAGYPYPGLFPLDAVVMIWKYQCDGLHWQFLERIAETMKKELEKH